MAVPSRGGASSRRVSRCVRTQQSRDPASRAIIRSRSEVYDSGLSMVDRLAQVLRWSRIRTVPGGPGQSRAARSVPGDHARAGVAARHAVGGALSTGGRRRTTPGGGGRSVGRPPIAALLSPARRSVVGKSPQLGSRLGKNPACSTRRGSWAAVNCLFERCGVLGLRRSERSGTAHTTTRHSSRNFASGAPRVEVRGASLGARCMVVGLPGFATYVPPPAATHPPRALPPPSFNHAASTHCHGVPPPTPACGQAEAALRAPGAAVRNVPERRSSFGTFDCSRAHPGWSAARRRGPASKRTKCKSGRSRKRRDVGRTARRRLPWLSPGARAAVTPSTP